MTFSEPSENTSKLPDVSVEVFEHDRWDIRCGSYPIWSLRLNVHGRHMTLLDDKGQQVFALGEEALAVAKWWATRLRLPVVKDSLILVDAPKDQTHTWRRNHDSQ